MLTYPSGGALTGNDFVMFQYYDYKSRKAAAGAGAPPALGMIQLYMPNSTPNVSNAQGWETASAVGPVGEFFRNASISAARAASAGTQQGGDFNGAIDAIKNAFGTAADKAGGIGNQLAVQGIASATNQSPNQLSSLATGKIFNPNLELTYNGPGLRTFSMAFNFLPRSQNESNAVNEIIRTFKTHGAPSEAGEQSMYVVPKVWNVTYVSGGRTDVMNRFKPAALTDVSVQANASLALHSTYDDGFPIETSLLLSFKEVEVITAEDHESVRGQGF